MGRRSYPPEFRYRLLDLLAAGREVADLRSTTRLHPVPGFGPPSTRSPSGCQVGRER